MYDLLLAFLDKMSFHQTNDYLGCVQGQPVWAVWANAKGAAHPGAPEREEEKEGNRRILSVLMWLCYSSN